MQIILQGAGCSEEALLKLVEGVAQRLSERAEGLEGVQAGLGLTL